jgi:hypothetical protein
MEEFHKHVLERLTNVEAELRELREVTWPVCQAQLDNGNNLNNILKKKSLLRWLDVDEIKRLLMFKGGVIGLTRDQVSCELREILVEARPMDTV